MNKTEYVYVDDNKEVQSAVDYLKQHDRLSYDTETTGLKLIGGFSRLLLMQLGTADVTYLFDARKIDAEPLREVLESKEILKILHNAKFDYQSTKLDTGIVIKNVFDTMLAYRLLTSGLIEDGQGGFVVAGFRDKSRKHWPYKSLDFLSKKYLGISLKKEIRETFVAHQYNKEFSLEQLEYAANDVVVLHPLCDILGQELLDKDLIDTALLEFQFVRPVSEMELNGVCINKIQWRKIIEDARGKAEELAKKLASILAPLSEQNTLFGESIVNIKSPEQLLDAFRKLGVQLENTEEKTLKKISHPLAEYLLDHRAYSKLISTYGEPILKKINRNTNRLHFTLHQMGADTGRLSSEKPNIQNIPQDREDQDVKISFRDCFVAEEGNKILTADYSQCIAEEEYISSQWGLVPIKDFITPTVTVKSFTDDIIFEDSSLHTVPSYTSSSMMPVIFKTEKGIKNTVIIKTLDGFELNCTTDHLIKTIDDLGVEYWKKASDLSTEDSLVLSRDWVGKDCHLSVEISPEESIFLGYFIGDGSFSSGGIQIAKGENKYNDVYDILNHICIQYFGKVLKNYPNTTNWDLIGKKYHQLWEHIGIRKEWNSHTKEVPETILKGGRFIISFFLQGLFEADGWVINNHSNHVVAFSTRSKKLSRQIQLLLLSLGIFSKRASYDETTCIKGKEYKGIQHRVSICDTFNLRRFYEQVGFLSIEKTRILESLVIFTHTSYSDYVVLTSAEKNSLKKIAETKKDWVEIRKDFFANYFNSNNEFIRHYSRTKLEEVCKSLDIPLLKPHLAFSKVKQVVQDKPSLVYDISVPSQNMFVAGGIFVHNCELRILAELSQDQRFLEIFHNNQDLHIITSQQVFDYTDDELQTYLGIKPKDVPDVDLLTLFSAAEMAVYKMVTDFRDKTKTINFGIIYGLSAWSLAERFKIPQDEAEEILDNYFKTYHGIKRWLNKNAYETVANRYAQTIIGRKKYFQLANPDDEEKFRRSKGATRRMGNNHVIQGTNADITKEALVQLQEIYEDIPDAKVLFTVHDEIISETSADIADYVAEIKAQVMKKAFHRFIKTVPVGKDDKVSVTIANHWTK